MAACAERMEADAWVTEESRGVGLLQEGDAVATLQ